MAFPKAQNALDWLTQCWNIGLGKRVVAGEDDWLVGPIGRVGETSADFLERLAAEQGLTIRRNVAGSGLLGGFSDWGVEIDPRVADFYQHTTGYTFEVSSVWEPRFGIFGVLLTKLFSRRVQQINLPSAKPGETVAFESQLIQLVDDDGEVVYTIWLRSIRATGEVVFYGIYSHCRLPSGDFGVKTAFPLPQGSATVVFGLREGFEGSLRLVSSMEEARDSGFCFFVEDSRGNVWKHPLPSVRQEISVWVGEDSELKAVHSMWLWSFKVYHMDYAIRKAGEGSKLGEGG